MKTKTTKKEIITSLKRSIIQALNQFEIVDPSPKMQKAIKKSIEKLSYHVKADLKKKVKREKIKIKKAGKKSKRSEKVSSDNKLVEHK